MTDPDLDRLLARRPSAVVEVTWLSRSQVTPRATAHLRFADGSQAKARRLVRADNAERLARLCAHAPAGSIARLLDREGQVVLEEWVEGQALGEQAHDLSLLTRAGALLASFATAELPAELVSPRVRPWRLDKLARDLDGLASASVIPRQAATELLQLGERTAPSTVDVGLMHLDLAPDNLVLLPSGELRSIDHESLTIGPHDGDLARTLQRWPMDREERAAFLDGYQTHRSASAYFLHEEFWSIHMLCGSLRFALAERPHWVDGLRQRLLAVLVPRSSPPARPGLLGLGLGEAAIAVRAPDADLAWLTGFVSPWFAGGAGLADWAIEATTGATVSDRAGPSVSTFTVDGAGGEFRSRSFWSGAGTLEDPALGLRLHLAPPEAYLDAVDQSRLRIGLLRLCRELLVAPAIAAGGVLLHASAFVLGGRGVLVLGPKGSGKTSLLLHALAEGAAYVSNDRVLVTPAAAHGIPTIVSIRPGTLDSLPEVARRLRDHPRWYKWTATELAARPVVAREHQALSPTQVCTLLQATPVASTTPALLLFPCIAAGARGLEPRRLGREAARARLAGNLLGKASIPEVFRPQGWSPEPARGLLLQGIADSTPAIEVAIGPDAWATSDAVARLIASVS